DSSRRPGSRVDYQWPAGRGTADGSNALRGLHCHESALGLGAGGADRPAAAPGGALPRNCRGGGPVRRDSLAAARRAALAALEPDRRGIAVDCLSLRTRLRLRGTAAAGLVG